ncbi:unnamed protein product [Brassica napus]|uniref:(rape) hypothetical protein n=1 Tax=Brassica napus TaxID=3708 RepID=A0A817AVC0_BRANA|nr:unnamed protein product [Brassica napus]
MGLNKNSRPQASIQRRAKQRELATRVGTIRWWNTGLVHGSGLVGKFLSSPVQAESYLSGLSEGSNQVGAKVGG